MKALFGCGSVRWLVAGLLVLVAADAVKADEAPEVTALQKATVDNKYTGLLAVISSPDDVSEYGEFSDYGPYEGAEWAGYGGLPAGNWVYVAPHWYIWKSEGKNGGPNIAKATVNGKYSGLLAVISVPDDKEEYGDLYDYGEYDGTEWGGYTGLPAGNWVYVFPHWYIWETASE